MAVTRDDVQDSTGQRTIIPGRGAMCGFGIAARYASGLLSINSLPGNPIQGEIGWGTGATFQNPLTNTLGNMLWVNVGNQASANWKNLDAVAALGATGVLGVAAGYKLARGVTALDGSNPTPVVTGLTTVVAATVSLEGTAAPGVGTSILTVASTNYATGALAVYAWKVTSSADTTLIASTGTENFEWIAVGT